MSEEDKNDTKNTKFDITTAKGISKFAYITGILFIFIFSTLRALLPVFTTKTLGLTTSEIIYTGLSIIACVSAIAANIVIDKFKR